MSLVWNQRVSVYLDKLETATESIDLILDDMHLSTKNVDSEKLAASTQALMQSIETLANLIQQREVLLRDTDSPQHGTTLVDKLLSTHQSEDARIARRCQKIAGTVETTHHRAMSIFVCQYHLAVLSSDLVRMLSGERTPPTYAKRQASHRGGLFNEAA